MKHTDTLFTKDRTRTSDAKVRGETAYEFLDRSSWLISNMMRNSLEEWVAPYSPDKEFLKMYKSKSDKQHYSASFELMIFTMLRKEGWSLNRHPKMSTSSKPDFEVQKDDVSFFLECTLSGHSFESEEEKNRKSTIEEIVDGIKSFPYWINIQFEVISETSISKKAFLKFLEDLKAASEGIPSDVLREHKVLYEGQGWKIRVSLYPKKDPSIKRSLGFIMDKAKTINSSKPILTALNHKKARKYGIEDQSYIICLNTNDLFTSDDCFSEALFGQYSSLPIDLRYSQDSLFYADGKAQNKKISAVITCRNFDLFTIDHSSISIWHNPFASHKIPSGILPFQEYIFEKEGNILIKKELPKKQTLFDLLNIDQDKYLLFKDKRTA